MKESVELVQMIRLGKIINITIKVEHKIEDVAICRLVESEPDRPSETSEIMTVWTSGKHMIIIPQCIENILLAGEFRLMTEHCTMVNGWVSDTDLEFILKVLIGKYGEYEVDKTIKQIGSDTYIRRLNEAIKNYSVRYKIDINSVARQVCGRYVNEKVG